MDLITDRHFEAFGRIVWAYAELEAGLKVALAGMLRTTPHDIFILTEPYSSLGLRNVAKSLSKLHLREGLSERLISIIGEFGSHSKVRNYIAHNPWTPGTRPGSIRPVRMDIRQGRADARGYEPDEPVYVLDDFCRCADALSALNIRLIEFLHETGMNAAITQRIQAKAVPNT